jgi:hypothetical protein
MSFEVQVVEEDKWKVAFIDEPSYLHALGMAPDHIEPELLSGTWLVVVFPVWSVPVRESVHAAIVVAKEFDGKFQLGVRPFNSSDENRKWWPNDPPPSVEIIVTSTQDVGEKRELRISSDGAKLPLWLVLRGGRIYSQASGPRTKDELSDLMAGPHAD